MNANLNISRLPNTPGVYIMRDSAARIIYIGKAVALRKRVASYFKNSPDMKTAGIISSLRHIDYILCASERDALVLERQLIKKYQPHYNSMWKDDKSYPWIKMTVKDDFPRVFLTRRKINDGSEYFGPYPNSGQVSSLMKWMQRVFKWRPCKIEISEGALPPPHKVKSCLYLHSGRCPGPCVGKITSKEYKYGLSKVKLFLSGRYKNLITAWKKDMAKASRGLDYELAAELRNRIGALESMSQRVTFREMSSGDISAPLKTTSALEELKYRLGLVQLPVTIETFDISNISGTDSVGSMVRFLNGAPDKSNYRKFRIKTVEGSDDFSSIREVVFRRYRRLKEEGERLPDLILIDGGPGQLAFARQALDALKLKASLVSLAKKEETIHFTDGREPLVLPRNSAALHILQAARDEAHRFAVSYHRMKREKTIFGKK